jgi:hypothetical protein
LPQSRERLLGVDEGLSPQSGKDPLEASGGGCDGATLACPLAIVGAPLEPAVFARPAREPPAPGRRVPVRVAQQAWWFRRLCGFQNLLETRKPALEIQADADSDVHGVAPVRVAVTAERRRASAALTASTQRAKMRKPTNAIASVSSAAAGKPAQPSQRGSRPWRRAASENAATSRIAASARHEGNNRRRPAPRPQRQKETPVRRRCKQQRAA